MILGTTPTASTTTPARWRSAIYAGTVFHRRFRPRDHRLSYRVFWLLFDLDEMPALDRGLRLFSHNKSNLFSFRDRDHGDGSDEPIRAQVDRQLAEAGIDIGGGPIRLFCMPRILGYVFNPLSAYFCHRQDGTLAAILYQVHNTFGQRHSYLIPVESETGPTIRQSCDKDFYVSPFMDMAMTYDFTVTPPAEIAALTILTKDVQGPLLNASLRGECVALSDVALMRMLLAHPLLTFKVTAGIHYEAIKLWLKGVRLRSQPPAPDTAVSVIRAHRT